MKMHSLLAIAAAANLMILSVSPALAQSGNFDFSNFDPAQMQKRMMEILPVP